MDLLDPLRRAFTRTEQEHPTLGTPEHPEHDHRQGARLIRASGGSVMADSPEAHGVETEWMLTGDRVSVGSSERCDVHLEGPGVAGEHLALVREADGSYRIADVAPDAVTRIDGLLGFADQLIDGVRITVGEVTLIYRNDAEVREGGGRQGGEGSGPQAQA